MKKRADPCSGKHVKASPLPYDESYYKFLLNRSTRLNRAIDRTSSVATEIGTESKNIVNKFWSDWQYRTGMTGR